MSEKANTLQVYESYYSDFSGPIGGDERFRWVIKNFFSESASPAHELLEVGCGEGSLLKLLRDKGYVVRGVDASETGVSKARAQKLDCVVSDSSKDKYPFAPGFFDTILCLETLEHLENPYHCMMEIKRVLKLGGRFMLSIPNPIIDHPFCYPGLFDYASFRLFLE